MVENVVTITESRLKELQFKEREFDRQLMATQKLQAQREFLLELLMGYAKP